jgi:hypothetical protein
VRFKRTRIVGELATGVFWSLQLSLTLNPLLALSNSVWVLAVKCLMNFSPLILVHGRLNESLKIAEAAPIFTPHQLPYSPTYTTLSSVELCFRESVLLLQHTL